MAKGIPYGISDFSRLIDQNYYYVDKTHFIPQIEEIANYLFLIRPRRFGKSVFLTMMRAYYDISQKDRFEERFIHSAHSFAMDFCVNSFLNLTSNSVPYKLFSLDNLGI